MNLAKFPGWSFSCLMIAWCVIVECVTTSVAAEIQIPTAAQREAASKLAAEKKESELRVKVTQGQPRAMVELATLLADRPEGNGWTGDISSLYEKAAAAGEWHAMTKLAEHERQADPPNEAKAKAWDDQKWAIVHSRADAGDADALIELGDVSAKREDFAESMRLYRKAADAGSAAGTEHLADLLRNHNKQLKVDAKEVRDWLRKAAEVGDAHFILQYGLYNVYGKRSPEQIQEGLLWIHRAADSRSARAMQILGDLSREGKVVPLNVNDAIEWYQREAAVSGYGLMTIADIYANGQGVTKDDAEAIRWYRKGADAGDTRAMCELGRRYFEGDSLPKNPVEGTRFYNQAARMGDSDAISVMSGLGTEYPPPGYSRPLPAGRFVETHFDDAIDFLRDVSGININVDWNALKADGIETTSPVTFSTTNQSVKEVLANIINSVGHGKIDSIISAGMVTLSTPARLEVLSALRKKHSRFSPGDPAMQLRTARRLPEIQFRGNQLADVFDFLRDVSGVPIAVDWNQLKANHIDRDTPITVRVRDVPLDRILEYILFSAGGDTPLDYELRPEGIVIVVPGN